MIFTLEWELKLPQYQSELSLYEKVVKLRRISFGTFDIETAGRIITEIEGRVLVRTVLIGKGPFVNGMKSWKDLLPETTYYFYDAVEPMKQLSLFPGFDILMHESKRYTKLSEKQKVKQAYRLLGVSIPVNSVNSHKVWIEIAKWQRINLLEDLPKKYISQHINAKTLHNYSDRQREYLTYKYLLNEKLD